MFQKIEQLRYNRSRSEPKLHLRVSRSQSEPKSSISKISGADRSRQSSKGPDRSGSKFEPIVHLWTPGSDLVSPRTSPATTSSWSSEEFPTNIFGGKRPPNQRPGSDHVTWGPMRGLEKNRMGRGHTSNRYQTDIATIRSNRPCGSIRWKSSYRKLTVFPHTRDGNWHTESSLTNIYSRPTPSPGHPALIALRCFYWICSLGCFLRRALKNILSLNWCPPHTEIFSKRRKIYSNVWRTWVWELGHSCKS